MLVSFNGGDRAGAWVSSLRMAVNEVINHRMVVAGDFLNLATAENEVTKLNKAKAISAKLLELNFEVQLNNPVLCYGDFSHIKDQFQSKIGGRKKY